MALKEIKNKIRSVNKTRKVTKAMEAVSAVKMRKSQERALAGRPYARAALTILKRVSGSFDAQSNLLVAPRPFVKNVGVIVITSDKGLAGSLNSSVLKQVHKNLADHNIDKENVSIIAIGKKGYEHFNNRDFPIRANFPSPEETATLDDINDMVNEITGGFLDNEYDECYLCYSNFKSTFEIEAVWRKLLPVEFHAVEETVQGITPEKGKFSEQEQEDKAPDTYTIEPDPETVFAMLIPRLIAIELYHGLVEAAASEHSSRMVAMKNATDKAGEMSQSLTLKFNKARQAIITREVSEIVGGMEVSS